MQTPRRHAVAVGIGIFRRLSQTYGPELRLARRVALYRRRRRVVTLGQGPGLATILIATARQQNELAQALARANWYVHVSSGQCLETWLPPPPPCPTR